VDNEQVANQETPRLISESGHLLEVAFLCTPTSLWHSPSPTEIVVPMFVINPQDGTSFVIETRLSFAAVS
jgi:hypothetical protein